MAVCRMVRRVQPAASVRKVLLSLLLRPGPQLMQLRGKEPGGWGSCL